MIALLIALLMLSLVAMSAVAAVLATRLRQANEDAAWHELEARHQSAEVSRLRVLYYGVDRTPGAA